MYIITIDIEKCQACGECVDNCPNQAFSLTEENGKKYAVFTGEPSECLGCMSCETCPEGAVKVTEL